MQGFPRYQDGDGRNMKGKPIEECRPGAVHLSAHDERGRCSLCAEERIGFVRFEGDSRQWWYLACRPCVMAMLAALPEVRQTVGGE